jgi:hypothetical protein
MIVADRDGWSVPGSVDEVRQAVATVLDSASEGARSDVIVVLNLLGARGMSEFRDLMPQGGSSAP